MEAAPSITARIGTFTSPSFASAVRCPVVGRWLLLLLVGVPALSMLCVLVIVVVAQIPSDGRIRMAVAVVLATVAVACCEAITRFLTKKMRQAWFVRGVAAEIDFTFSILPEGLQVTSDVGVAMIRWPFINEVMPVRGHWLMVTPGNGFGLPRRSFPSEAEERTFLMALLDHLEPSARTRSRKAEKVLGRLSEV
jgi:hypothetical protein